MNTVKKIEFEILPQDFSPHTLPEIMKLAKEIKDNTAFVYERLNKPFFMETDRLIIRRFTGEDAESVQALSLDRMNSSMKNFDEQWPTDLEGCKGAAVYFAGEDTFYAVCLKPSMNLIGFISYNSVSDEGNLSMGHVWLTAYQDNSLDTEALSIMMQYAFEKMGVNKIFNTNPLECEEQIAPLKSIGMEIVETGKASFVKDKNGNPIEFTFCRMLMTKEQWEEGYPEGYSPKNKPEILNMMEQNSVTMSDIITGLQAGGEPPMLTGIRELFEGMKGHNYELPDCLKFIFERLGDYDELDFWDISALSGDTVAQVYNHNITTSCSYSVSAYLAGREHIDYMFNAFGYGYEYVTAEQFNVDTALYLRKTIEYINNGIPVLVKTNLNDIPAWHSDVGTYCLIVGVGYENEKVALKLLVGGTVPINYELTGKDKIDLIFIGEKQCEVTIEEIYIKTINKMLYWLTLPEHDGMFFGAAAYRAWADDIENGRFTDGNIPLWENYGVYVVNLATSGSGGPAHICSKLAGINHKYSALLNLKEKLLELTPAEGSDGSGRNLLWIKLDDLGGGMDMNAVRETMHDREKRLLVATALRDYAKKVDEVVKLLKEVLQ